MDCYLVLLETSGNQNFIFDTNKRRENVGASHLIASLVAWTEESLEGLVRGWTRRSRVPAHTAELVTATSGDVKVLLTDGKRARELVTRVTRKALEVASGLDVCGVVIPFQWDDEDPDPVMEAITTAYATLPEVRTRRAGPQSRFPRLPIVDQCTSSGLPAAYLYDETSGRRSPRRSSAASAEPVPRSHPSAAKLEAARDGYDRLARVTVGWVDPTVTRRTAPWEKPPTERDRPESAATPAGGSGVGISPWEARDGIEAVADYLERHAEWVAVVHADVNGLGAVLRNLTTRQAVEGCRGYVDLLAVYSERIDRAAHEAFRAALDELRCYPGIKKVRRPDASGSFFPVLPLILGGDDLTVVCDGPAALPFTAAFLQAFENRTAALLHPKEKQLTAAAGVAVVKQHYPFSSAYQLADDLTDEAKRVKVKAVGASALSFHVLYDSAATGLDNLRARTTLPGGDRLVAQPYVVTGNDNAGWADGRRWSDLLARVTALRGTVDPTDGDSDRGRALPRSQTHTLRAGLFLGRDTADGRFQLLRNRYGRSGLSALAANSERWSLFWEEGGVHITGLLDAMDAEEFIGDRDETAASR
ncbi:hypothetical protein [Frankia sp. Cj3]|uniref:Cas10/Cmr2 second palm domain-containing protein n=1 Tax=Frankia sp. Cj3 TaxID=2880976 RepID=UPI001EF46F40|nr:hypothetical protein [Frankia sp. Cj3]